MSVKFRITKDDTGTLWLLLYPDGFDATATGRVCDSFDDAIEEFIDASEAQCPTCLKGAVVSTDFGWLCKACGSYDVAVGCTDPGPVAIALLLKASA